MDIAEINISEPVFLKDEDYLCKLSQKDNDILLNVDVTPSIVNFIHGTSEHLVLNNNDIKIMKQIYDKAVDLVHENTEEWFENKLELADVKNAFVPFIVPDIENNCLGVKCSLNEDVEYNKDEKYISVTLKVVGVVLNSNSFKINLVLDKLNKVEEKQEQTQLVEEVHNQEQELNSEPQNEVVSETQPVEEEENTQEQTQESVEENLVLATDNLDELTEVDFTNDNLDKLDMSIEKDNLFLYYDIINDKIKENMYYSLENILKKRNFKNNNFDIEEILFDDETVNDEDDYMDESDNEMMI
jgi:hypothetical protein